MGGEGGLNRSSVRLFVCSSVRLFVCLSVCLFVCSSVRLFVCSSVRLFVCPALSGATKMEARVLAFSEYNVEFQQIPNTYILKDKMDQ